MNIRIISISGLLVFFFSHCTSGPKEGSGNSQQSEAVTVSNQQDNLNVSLFLDLSDRIDPAISQSQAMPFHERDLAYITTVVNAFKSHILNKRVINMNDRIQLYIDPPPSNANINGLVEELKIELNRNNVTKELVNSIDSVYVVNCRQIYDLAIQDGAKGAYPGSDIWGFFKYKVKDYCIKPDFRNVLVILTDGYAFHENNKIVEGNKSSYLTSLVVKKKGFNKSNWAEAYKANNHGFILANSDLQDLDVLVLGINPSKENPFEEDVIRTYWSDWLTGMGVQNFAIKAADLPSNLEDVISEFILSGK